jgi:methyl-accepting chemotaxis protein
VNNDERTPRRAGPAETTTARAGVRVGLSLKIVGIAGLATALVAAILALSFAREVRKLLEHELTTRGRMGALGVANTAAGLIFSQDTTALEAITAATLGDVPGAAYVVVRDDRGNILASAAEPALGAARPAALDLRDMDLGSRILQRTVSVAGREMLHVVALVSFQGKSETQYLDPLGLAAQTGAGSGGLKVLGTVELGFPLAELTGQIGAASRRSIWLAALVLAGCVATMFPLVRFVTRPLTELSRAALGIARGDLRQQVKRIGNDEVADLGRSFGRMVEELQAMLAELKAAAAALADESGAMLQAATRQAAAATEQSAAISEMNASIHEIAQTSSTALAHADRVITVTESAEESSRAGGGLVDEAVGSTSQVEQHVAGIAARLGELSGRVGQIGDIIGTVKDLAARSNVLALNAAIQAARSGDAGSSFTVIAREMRALAEQSADAAGEVPRLLGEIVQSTRAAASATEQGADKARSTAEIAGRAGATIGSLAGVIRESAAAARQIADTSRQQATGVNEIVTALSQLARAAEGNVEDSQETRRVAERLKAVSGRLTGLAERYRS